MAPPCFAMAHHLREGHRLVLRLSTADPDKVPLFAIDPQITVSTGPGATSIQVPVVEHPILFPDDMPLVDDPPRGPAAQSLSREVTTTAPGAPLRQPELTSYYIPFTVPADSDTARGEVTATVSLPADIDLYLQRSRGGGEWSGDMEVGGSASLTGETMVIDQPLQPGEYRIEVHNWAGPPLNTVRVTAHFYIRPAKWAPQPHDGERLAAEIGDSEPVLDVLRWSDGGRLGTELLDLAGVDVVVTLRGHPSRCRT